MTCCHAKSAAYFGNASYAAFHRAAGVFSARGGGGARLSGTSAHAGLPGAGFRSTLLYRTRSGGPQLLGLVRSSTLR